MKKFINVFPFSAESGSGIDGSVSFTLEWNDLKFVFSSDTYPNKWFAEFATDADLVIHECFIAVPDLVTKMGWTPEMALQVGTQIHTAPEAFGKVMSAVETRPVGVGQPRSQCLLLAERNS